MHKKILGGLLIACCCAGFAFAQAHKSDRERDGLFGPVKSVLTEKEEEASGPKGKEIDKIFQSSATYDRNGNLLEDQANMTDFVRKRKAERIDTSTVKFHSAMGNSTEHYKFDAAGNITEMTVTYGEGKDAHSNTSRYKYDAQGRMSEDDTVDDDGKVRSYILYTHDTKGNLVKQENCLNGAKPPCATGEYTYKFDAHGNWIWRAEKDSHIPPEDAYMYEDNGPLVRTFTYYNSKAQ